MNMYGKNFNEEPLTFEEFISLNSGGIPVFNNFFYRFQNSTSSKKGINYTMLSKHNQNLSDKVKKIAIQYAGFYDRIPREDLKTGYKAYLVLREKYKEDVVLRNGINRYKTGTDWPDCPDDRPAFFA